MVYFDPAWIRRELEEEIAGGIEVVQPVVQDPLLAQNFAQLFASLTMPYLDVLAREECLVRSLLCVLQRHGVRRPASNNCPSPPVTKALRRLDAARNESVSLAELAALAGVSRLQLLRGFAREIGTTPHAYVIRRRVRLARQLLAAGETPAQAAVEAGFADQSHPTRAFVRHVGITPGRYRAAVT
jgi:AraC-like DNA-binding protein